MTAFVFLEGPAGGRRVVLGAAPVVIGRESGDLVIDDALLSRRHASFRASATGMVVEDLGSTNGTWVNGGRITAPTEVGSHDRVVLGASTLGLEAETVQAPAPAASVPQPPPQHNPAFAPIEGAGSRRIASRQLTPTLLSLATIVATAVALIAYFAAR